MLFAVARDIWIMPIALVLGCLSETPSAGRPSALGDDGDAGEVGGDAWPPPTSGPFTTGATGEGDENDEPPPMPPDLGACSSDADCMFEGEDDTCFVTQGTCEFGQCIFEAAAPGTPCDDGDPCTEADVCNGMGVCLGNDAGCDEPPPECDPGFADCDEDPDNGCETELGTDEHCDACNAPCIAGPHVASTTCEANACVVTCEDPWEDCNGDPSDGCEIPTGVPNQCDADGLNPDTGCWTAHCGSSDNPDAVNFDAWFCFECTTCRLVGETDCQWCSHSSGRWFATEACDCAADPTDCLCVVDEVSYLELVCAP